jgi:hypothetical protein
LLSTRTLLDPEMLTGNDLSNIRVLALYRGYSDNEPPTGAPAIHMARLASLTPGVHNVSLWAQDSSYKDNFLINSSEFAGFYISLPAPGIYRMDITNDTEAAPGEQGLAALCTADADSFDVKGTDEYYATVGGKCGVAAAPESEQGMPPGYVFGIVVVGLLILAAIFMAIVFCSAASKFKRARRAARAAGSSVPYGSPGSEGL